MLTIPERLGKDFEVFRKLLDQFGARLRVAAPGIIQSFDATTQTATVQLAIREKINIDGDLSWEEIPELVDVPVYMPRAGNFVLTMPVTDGDECLVVFGDNCMDAWWQSGGIQNQVDRRRHDLSDGYALVGIWSQPRKVSGYSTAAAQLRNLDGDVKVEITDSAVNIKADVVTIDVQTLLYLNGNNRAIYRSRGFVTNIDGGTFLNVGAGVLDVGSFTDGGSDIILDGGE